MVLTSPQDGAQVSGVVILQATKADADVSVRWVTFVLTGGAFTKPELIAAVSDPGGGRMAFEYAWDTSAVREGERRVPDGSYTLTMTAHTPGGRVLATQQISVIVANAAAGAQPAVLLRYRYPKNRIVNYSASGSATISDGDKDDWVFGTAGAAGSGSEGGYGGYGGSAAYGGYGMSGGYGGAAMPPPLTLKDALATLSGRVQAEFSSHVLGIYVPENAPADLGGIVRHSADRGVLNMNNDDRRSIWGTGQYFHAIALEGGPIRSLRAGRTRRALPMQLGQPGAPTQLDDIIWPGALESPMRGEYHPFGSLYVALPDQPLRVGDSWTGPMAVLMEFSHTQGGVMDTIRSVLEQRLVTVDPLPAPRVIVNATHTLEAIELLHGRRCARIQSDYTYKGEAQLRLADWIMMAGGGMGGAAGAMGGGGMGMASGPMGSSGSEGAQQQLPPPDARLVEAQTDMSGKQTMHFAIEEGRIERLEQTNEHKLEIKVEPPNRNPGLAAQPPQMMMGGYGPGAYGPGGYGPGYGPTPPYGGPTATPPYGGFAPGRTPAVPRLPGRGGRPGGYDEQGMMPTPGPYGPTGSMGGYGGYPSGYGGYMGAYGGAGGYGQMGGMMQMAFSIDRDYTVHFVVEARD